jgi:hypothetical protein
MDDQGNNRASGWPQFSIKNLFVVTTCVSVWAALLGIGLVPVDSSWPLIVKRLWVAFFGTSLMVLPIVAASSLLGKTKEALFIWLFVMVALFILIRWS